MKTIIYHFKKTHVLLTSCILSGLLASGYAQTITLTPTATGSESDALYTDASVLQVNASGAVSYYNSNSSDDWTVSAENITQTGALGKTFSISWGGMAMVNTAEGNNYGKMITPGGIDRDATGLLGIRGTTNGIDKNEGYYFGLDLSSLSTDVAVQITKISVAQLADAGETGVVVSLLDPTQRINFGNSTLGGSAGTIDVSSLHLYAAGGSANSTIVSVFNNSAIVSNWRITKLELKVAALSSLPVSLAHFTATPQEQAIKLQWKTLSEQNNKEFIVLHSSDGSIYNPITTLPGAGNSNTPNSYEYYDYNALNGINYYKLIQTDGNGNQNEAGIQAVRFGAQSSKIDVFPNPTDNEINVIFKEGTYHTLALTNMQGKVLQTIPVEQDATKRTINLRPYGTGVYLIQLQGERTSEIHKLIKK